MIRMGYECKWVYVSFCTGPSEYSWTMAVKRLCVCFSEIWDLWAAGRTVPEDQAMTTVDKSTGNMDRIGRVDTQRKHKET